MDGVGLKVFGAVGRDKTTEQGIVVTGVQVVEARPGIVVVPTVTNGIDIPDMGRIGHHAARQVIHLVVPPRVVDVRRHARACGGVQGNHVTQHIVFVIIRGCVTAVVIQESDQPRIGMQEG